MCLGTRMLNDDFYIRQELTIVENDSDGEKYLLFVVDDNNLNIGFYDDEAETVITLSILQAKALRDFLNYAIRDA